MTNSRWSARRGSSRSGPDVMGIFKRPDSPYWWIWLEGAKRKERTNIRIRGRAEKREAEERYFALMLDQAEADTDALLVQAIVRLQRRQAKRDQNLRERTVYEGCQKVANSGV